MIHAMIVVPDPELISENPLKIKSGCKGTSILKLSFIKWVKI